MSADESHGESASRAADATNGEAPDVRATRRAQREAERAARAQRKADAARARALAAARAGGLFDGMQAMPAATEPAVEPAADAAPVSRSAETIPPAPAPTPDRRAADADTDTDHPLGERRRFAAVFAIVTVIALVVAGLATWGYVGARGDTKAEQAITAAPYEATEAAREIVTQMFTYDHRTVDADLGAVRDRLVDPALSEFVERSMPSVAAAAKEQEATVFATVAAAAPEEIIDADHATVLVMVNRMVSTKEDPKAASSASRLRVDMVHTGDGWKLGELTAL